MYNTCNIYIYPKPTTIIFIISTRVIFAHMRENMDPSVAAMFADANKKKDLFNLWLTHARDFGKVTLEVSRRNTQRQSAHANTVTWSRAQLEQSGRYTATDINDLIQRAVAAGRFIDDPNFPGVERLRRYMIVDEVGQQTANIREDTTEINNQGAVSTQEAVSLTNQGPSAK